MIKKRVVIIGKNIKPKPKPAQPTKPESVPKPIKNQAKKPEKEAPQEEIIKTSNGQDVKKLGRNSDGTFKKGNQISVGNSGRPQNEYSYRAMAKVRALKNPERIQRDLDALDGIIDSPQSKPLDVIHALEIKIKLNGNFDPQETKDVTPPRPESPLNGLTVEELRKLKALKKGAKND